MGPFLRRKGLVEGGGVVGGGNAEQQVDGGHADEEENPQLEHPLSLESVRTWNHILCDNLPITQAVGVGPLSTSTTRPLEATGGCCFSNRINTERRETLSNGTLDRQMDRAGAAQPEIKETSGRTRTLMGFPGPKSCHTFHTSSADRHQLTDWLTPLLSPRELANR